MKTAESSRAARRPRPAERERGAWRGFTLIELLVAMFITLVLGSLVIAAYNTSMESYYRTEKQLQALAAFRNVTDRLEREVNSIVFKASVYPHPVYTGEFQSPACPVVAWWDTRIKYIGGEAMINSDPYAWGWLDGILPNGADVQNPVAASPARIAPGQTAGLASVAAGDWWKMDTRGLFQINFRPQYMGYYSTMDGFTVDRTEWYYNPPEERRFWADGLDNDNDDPYGLAGLRILFDDKGCLMFRKTLDKDMLWAEWDAASGRPNYYRDQYHGPYSRADFPPQADELVGPIMNLWDNGTPGDPDTPDGIPDNIDTGTVIGENFTDLRFYYLYKIQTSDKFIYADWWPWDDDNNPARAVADPSEALATQNGKDSDMPVVRIGTHIGGEQGGRTHPSGTSDAPDWVVTPDPVAYKDFDIAYFSLPMAISARFTFQAAETEVVYEKLIYLHASRWLKYLNP